MKKQPRGAERKSRKGAGVKDLAPGAKKQSGVKAGAAFDAFSTGVDTSRSHERWIEITSVSGFGTLGNK